MVILYVGVNLGLLYIIKVTNHGVLSCICHRTRPVIINQKSIEMRLLVSFTGTAGSCYCLLGVSVSSGGTAYVSVVVVHALFPTT